MVLGILCTSVHGAAAVAAERVLTSGDPALAILLVASRAAVPANELQPTTLGELFAAKRFPILSAHGRIEGCGGVAIGHDPVAKALSDAEGDVLYMEYAKVVDHLTKVAQVLPCLNQAVTADELSRMWFLLGFSAAMEGRPDVAQQAFRSALLAKPDLAWDPNFPPQAQGIFTAVRAEQGVRSRLAVVPAHDTWIRIDGLLTTDFSRALFLSPGPHLIQVGKESVVSYVLHLEPEKSHLVVLSASVDEAVLAWAGDAERLGDLAALLALALPEGQRTFVVHAGQVVAGRVGGAWATLATAAAEADQRSVELRDAAKALRVSSPVGFYSPELDLWLARPGEQRVRVTSGQALLLPLGRSAVEAHWGELHRDFPLDVAESSAVLEALKQGGGGNHASLVVPGPGLPLPWGLEVHVNGETVLRDLYPGTQSEAFVALDMLLVGTDRPVRVAGSVLGMPGAVRTLQLDPGRHPAIPLLDAVTAARAVKRKDAWVAPVAVGVGTALGTWAAYNAVLSSEAAAAARGMSADVERVDAYLASAAQAQELSDQAWILGTGSGVLMGLGVSFELTIGGEKRRKVAAAWAAYDASTSAAVPVEQLLVEWQ